MINALEVRNISEPSLKISSKAERWNISRFIRRVGMKTIKVTEKGEEEDIRGTFAVSYLLVFIYFVLFFILGYFLYGILYASIGAMVNSEKKPSSF